MFFKNLFKPKWQHQNPQVRKQALLALDVSHPESAAIFAQIAKIDLDPVIRQLAARKVADMELLRDLIATDKDATVREFAIARYRRLLAGLDPGCSTQQSIQMLPELGDKDIEFLARQAVDPSLRAAAINHVKREATFADIAMLDPDLELRFAALTHVTQKSTLERILKNTRTRDKRISGEAERRIALLTAQAEQPARWAGRVSQLCAELESLYATTEKRGDWEDAATRFARIQQDWQVLQAERCESGLTIAIDDVERRIARAEKSFAQALEAWQKQLALEAEFSPLLKQKFALLDALSAIQINDVHTTDSDNVAANLEQITTQWANCSKLGDEDEITLQARFSKQCAQIEARLSEQQRHAAGRVAADELLRQLLDNANMALSERELSDYARRWQSLTADTTPKDPQREQQFQIALSAQRERAQQYKAQRQALLEQFKDAVIEVETALSDGRVKDAAALAQRVQQLLSSSALPDRQYLHKQTLHQRWRVAFAQVKELLDWRGWANTPLKEQLCQEMETLAAEIQAREQGHDLNAQSMLNQLKALQARWVKLGASEPEAEGLLRERFQNAADKAYEICRQEFAKFSAQRQVSLLAKQQICQRLEGYLTAAAIGSGSSIIDEPAALRFLDAAQEEWRSLGAVDRDQHISISERYKTAVAAIKTAISQQRLQKREQKEALIMRAEKIAQAANAEDASVTLLHDLTEQAKALQVEWKQVGYAAQEKELWQRFRVENDKVFTARKQIQDSAKQERDTHLATKIALCEQIEQLAQLQGDDLRQARVQIEQAKVQWEAIGQVPKQAANALLQRFRDALSQFESQDRARIAAFEQAKEAAIGLKAQLCMEMEVLADEVIAKRINREHATAKLSTAQGAWERIQPLDAHAENAMCERFQNATDVILAADAWGDAVLERLNSDKTANLQKREELCLQLEVLAQVESPPYAKQARMEFQVAQLAHKMTHGKVEDDMGAKFDLALHIERQWYFIGPAPKEQTPLLEQRFNYAWSVITTGQNEKKT